jgi:hypothetical protein
MLSSISWSQYITFLSLALIGYYLYISYKYFRWEILGLIGIKRIVEKEMQIPVAEVKKQFTSSNHNDYLPKDNTDSIFQSFADEVKAYLYQANSSAPKEEILFALQQIISKYPAIKTIEDRAAINEFILGETEKHYQDFLNDDDLVKIWFS